MKKRWQMGMYLLLYLLALSFLLGFDIRRLIGFRDIGAFLVGTVLLALPFYNESGSRTDKWYRFLETCGRHAIDAGVIQTFLLLFVRMSQRQNYIGLPAEIALCFRPMLYAFCTKLILEKDERNWSREDDSFGKQHGETGSFTEDGLQIKEITYEDCIQAGLTKREAEIALLVCRGCSNGEISEELVISQATVKKHMSNIFEKTDISKREELQEYIMLQQHARL